MWTFFMQWFWQMFEINISSWLSYNCYRVSHKLLHNLYDWNKSISKNIKKISKKYLQVLSQKFKKNLHWSKIGKILFYLKKNYSETRRWQASVVFSKKSIGVGTALEKFCIFYPNLCLQKLFPTLKIAQDCCLDMKIALEI